MVKIIAKLDGVRVYGLLQSGKTVGKLPFKMVNRGVCFQKARIKAPFANGFCSFLNWWRLPGTGWIISKCIGAG